MFPDHVTILGHQRENRENGHSDERAEGDVHAGQFSVLLIISSIQLDKLFDIRFSYKHCNFSRGYGFKNCDKVFTIAMRNCVRRSK